MSPPPGGSRVWERNVASGAGPATHGDRHRGGGGGGGV